MSRKMLSRECELIDSDEIRAEIEILSNLTLDNVTVDNVYSSINSILEIRLLNCPKMKNGLKNKLDKNKRLVLKETRPRL